MLLKTEKHVKVKKLTLDVKKVFSLFKKSYYKHKVIFIPQNKYPEAL